MTHIRCLLFDAVGTLLCPHPPVAEAYWAAGRRHGSTRDAAAIAERFRHAFRDQERLDAEAGDYKTDESRERSRWRAIVAQTLDDATDRDAVFEELWLHFAQSESWRLFDDVAGTWQRLAGLGLQLGIASNFDRRLREVCRGLPPLDGCDNIFVSSELGMRKPAPEFFRQVQQQLRLAPHEIMLVGDDWTNDYLAATQCGWKATYLDRRSQHQAAGDRIRSLRELCDAPAES